jgi:hypothetical protein
VAGVKTGGEAAVLLWGHQFKAKATTSITTASAVIHPIKNLRVNLNQTKKGCLACV